MKTTILRNAALSATLLLALASCSNNAKTTDSADTTAMKTDTSMAGASTGTPADVKPTMPAPDGVQD